MSKAQEPEIITLKPKKLIGFRVYLESINTEDLVREIIAQWEINFPSFYKTLKENNQLDNLVSEMGYDVPEALGESRWHFIMVEVHSRLRLHFSVGMKDIRAGLAAKLIVNSYEEAEQKFEDFLETWLDDNHYELSNNKHFLKFSSMWNPKPPFECYFPIKKKRGKRKTTP